jgi:hypothetical protein
MSAELVKAYKPADAVYKLDTPGGRSAAENKFSRLLIAELLRRLKAPCEKMDRIQDRVKSNSGQG